MTRALRRHRSSYDARLAQRVHFARPTRTACASARSGAARSRRSTCTAATVGRATPVAQARRGAAMTGPPGRASCWPQGRRTPSEILVEVDRSTKALLTRMGTNAEARSRDLKDRLDRQEDR
jgi:hypothetical protein